nr:hypothetical protein GCM10025699_76770 [Microbacterium flavescens]
MPTNPARSYARPRGERDETTGTAGDAAAQRHDRETGAAPPRVADGPADAVRPLPTTPSRVTDGPADAVLPLPPGRVRRIGYVLSPVVHALCAALAIVGAIVTTDAIGRVAATVATLLYVSSGLLTGHDGHDRRGPVARHARRTRPPVVVPSCTRSAPSRRPCCSPPPTCRD